METRSGKRKRPEKSENMVIKNNEKYNEKDNEKDNDNNVIKNKNTSNERRIVRVARRSKENNSEGTNQNLKVYITVLYYIKRTYFLC